MLLFLSVLNRMRLSSYGYEIVFHPTLEFRVKTCRNCISYRIKTSNVTKESGVCHLFGRVDLETGRTDYFSCRVCRSHSELCGQEGKYYFDYRNQPQQRQRPPSFNKSTNVEE